MQRLDAKSKSTMQHTNVQAGIFDPTHPLLGDRNETEILFLYMHTGISVQDDPTP